MVARPEKAIERGRTPARSIPIPFEFGRNDYFLAAAFLRRAGAFLAAAFLRAGAFLAAAFFLAGAFFFAAMG